jgi:hypothetical protein
MLDSAIDVKQGIFSNWLKKPDEWYGCLSAIFPASVRAFLSGLIKCNPTDISLCFCDEQDLMSNLLGMALTRCNVADAPKPCSRPMDFSVDQPIVAFLATPKDSNPYASRHA